MTETFTQLAGRAAMHRTIIRRNQFSKRIWYPGTGSDRADRIKENREIIICR